MAAIRIALAGKTELRFWFFLWFFLLDRLGGRMTDQAQLLPGTLDLLILKAVSLGPLHGYGVLLRIGQISEQALLIEQGALYPALFRLVRQGLLKASWGVSENNRRAKFYELTAAGRKRFREETEGWNRVATAMAAALAAEPEEV
jgi:transcriptional regulator